jgi:outer membrane protein
MSPMHFSGLLRQIRQYLPLLLSFSVYAKTSPAQAVASPGSGSKYAVVDMQSVILNVEEGKQARADLEKQIKAKEKDLMKKKEELDKMNQEWEKQAPLLNEQARMGKQKEFQEKFMSLRNEEMTFQNEIKGKEQAATQKIAIAVSKLVNSMAKQRNVDMVFETNSAGLLYLKDPLDMTKDVIAAFEAQSKKGDTAKK